jgi:hypothetical protein
MDPNHGGAPSRPPSSWEAMLRGIQGIVQFFGRLSFLVDENAHAVHFFIGALLQLLDRWVIGPAVEPHHLCACVARLLVVRESPARGDVLLEESLA